MRKKTESEVPLKPPIPFLENYSNGEFFHEQTPRDRLINKLILEKADEKARKLGVDRRQFLASAAGMVTSLSLINTVSGCGSDGGATGGSGGFNTTDAPLIWGNDADKEMCMFLAYVGAPVKIVSWGSEPAEEVGMVNGLRTFEAGCGTVTAFPAPQP